VGSSGNLVVLILGALVLIEGGLCFFLFTRITGLRKRLDVAIRSAEDAARAAALASPGGIDPEVVIALLRSGQPVTLDAVYAEMEQQARTPAPR
jgi:hypothetical protein